MSTHETQTTETPRDEFARPVDYTSPQEAGFSIVKLIEQKQRAGRVRRSRD